MIYNYKNPNCTFYQVPSHVCHFIVSHKDNYLKLTGYWIYNWIFGYIFANYKQIIVKHKGNI